MSRLHETSLSHVLFNVSEIAGESSSCSYKHRWGCFEQSAPLSASCLPLDDTGQVNGIVCALERRLYLQCCDGLFPACCVSTSGGDGGVTCNGPITLSGIDESGCVFLAVVEIELVVCVLWKACLWHQLAWWLCMQSLPTESVLSTWCLDWLWREDFEAEAISNSVGFEIYCLLCVSNRCHTLKSTDTVLCLSSAVCFSMLKPLDDKLRPMGTRALKTLWALL